MSNPTREQAIAQERAGDKAGAQATRTALLLQQRSQDAFFLTLRSQLLKKQGRTADRPGPTAGEGKNGRECAFSPRRPQQKKLPSVQEKPFCRAEGPRLPGVEDQPRKGGRLCWGRF